MIQLLPMVGGSAAFHVEMRRPSELEWPQLTLSHQRVEVVQSMEWLCMVTLFQALEVVEQRTLDRRLVHFGTQNLEWQ